MSGVAGLELCSNAINENEYQQQWSESMSGRSLLIKYLDVIEIKLQKLLNQISTIIFDPQQSQIQQQGIIFLFF